MYFVSQCCHIVGKKSLFESRVSCTLKNSRMNNKKDPTNGIAARTSERLAEARRLRRMMPFRLVFFQKYRGNLSYLTVKKVSV